MALLFEFDSLAPVLAAQSLLRRQNLPGVCDIVAAAQTLLVTADSPATLEKVRRLLAAPNRVADAPSAWNVHTINTQYDGADLTEAAGLAGLSVQALVSWHTAAPWRAAFGGFAPGFMYLSRSESPLSFPRRKSPRTVVPAGSVAVGGEFSAIYPGPSPGGWQLLGRCAETLWNAEAASPSLIQPGDTVQFQPVRELISLRKPAPAPTVSSSPSSSGLLVQAPGPFTTVQDLGRPGYAHLGVTASGALDRAALRRANRMVGNSAVAPGAAGLEILATGLVVQAVGHHLVAVTGSAVQLSVMGTDGQPRAVSTDAPFPLSDSETLSITALPREQRPGAEPLAAPNALRSYLAIRGGIGTLKVLGSRATDVLSGLGPDILRTGTFLPVGPGTGVVGLPETAPPPPPHPTTLRFHPGPRHNWFTQESLTCFERQLWTVSSASNRIGLRFELSSSDGTALERTASALAHELPSEGMVDGAIQVPPSGLPVLFLADHPVTGGYPVVGVVFREDLDRAASLAPGALVRFSRG